MINKSVLAAVAGLALSGVAASDASAITVNDQYWGGLSVPSESNADIFGGDKYSVTSMDANRVGLDLNVVISTNYVANIGDAGTFLGSLFIGSGPISYAGTGPEYREDTYVANPGRFSHAFDFDTANEGVTGGSGAGSLWNLAGGSVSTSTVRLDQAVDRTGGSDTGLNGTWTISAGSITFNISNFFANNIGIDTTSLILAWTMSCGNDVIIADGLNFGRPGEATDVPLPAAAWFLLSGLAGMGYLKRRQTKQA
jgi:hypothetical protein